MPTPISYCHWPWASWEDSRGWPQVPKNQTVRAPCGPHGPTSASVLLLQGPKSLAPKTLDLWGPGCPQMLPPLTEKAASTCALPGPAQMPSSCIFFYFLTEWTLHTLAQDSAGWCGVRTGEPHRPRAPRETQLLEPSPGAARRPPRDPVAQPLLSHLLGVSFPSFFFLIYPLFPFCFVGLAGFLLLLLFVLHGVEPHTFSATPGASSQDSPLLGWL